MITIWGATFNGFQDYQWIIGVHFTRFKNRKVDEDFVFFVFLRVWSWQMKRWKGKKSRRVTRKIRKKSNKNTQKKGEERKYEMKKFCCRRRNVTKTKRKGTQKTAKRKTIALVKKVGEKKLRLLSSGSSNDNFQYCYRCFSLPLLHYYHYYHHYITLKYC